MGAVVPGSPLDRIFGPIRRLVAELVAPLKFLGTYGYTVTATDGTTVDGEPNDATQGLPPAAGWPMRSCVCGATATPTVGSRCLVTFEDGDPGKPLCVGVDGPPVSAALDATDELDLGASASTVAVAGGGQGIARTSDAVDVTLSTAQAANIIAPVGGGPCSILLGGTLTLTGAITGGSTKGTCG